LLGSLRYTLPEEVDRSLWEVALRHFAERQPTEAQFRQLLERRMRRSIGQNGPMPGSDAGARLAAYLLREWQRYQVAVRLRSARGGKQSARPASVPTRRSSGPARRRERAAQVALLQRLGVELPATRQPPTQASGRRPRTIGAGG
jgi:hypothetical protein